MKKKIQIGIIGLGYVGLSLVKILLKKGIPFIGFDKNQSKINLLKKKRSYITDVSNKDLAKINPKNLSSSFNSKNISLCDYLMICVPTPLKNKNEPDMKYVKEVFNEIYSKLRPGQTIILESTVYPGATREIFQKKLNKKFILGKNFYLGFSPERIDPGVKKRSIPVENVTKLVSGNTNECLNKVENLYKKIFKNTYRCNNLEEAEISKLFENTFRSVNIGLVNEFKMLCNKININFHHIVTAASTKPFGFRGFSPGPGVGGHCIPIDPLFVSWFAKKKNFNTNFIKLSNKVNLKVTNWTISRILQVLKKMNKNKIKILILGIAYKKNINDDRESPSKKIFEKLYRKKNFIVEYTDPYIPYFYLDKKKMISKKNTLKEIKDKDLIIIATDHTNINYRNILNHSKLIIDTRGVYKNYKSPKIIHV